MIEDAKKELRHNQQVAARREVEIEYLDKEVKNLRQDQEQAKQQMKKLRDQERAEFTIGDKTYTRKEVENELRRLQRYEYLHKELQTREEAFNSAGSAMSRPRT